MIDTEAIDFEIEFLRLPMANSCCYNDLEAELNGKQRGETDDRFKQ